MGVLCAPRERCSSPIRSLEFGAERRWDREREREREREPVFTLHTGLWHLACAPLSHTVADSLYPPCLSSLHGGGREREGAGGTEGQRETRPSLACFGVGLRSAGAEEARGERSRFVGECRGGWRLAHGRLCRPCSGRAGAGTRCSGEAQGILRWGSCSASPGGHGTTICCRRRGVRPGRGEQGSGVGTSRVGTEVPVCYFHLVLREFLCVCVCVCVCVCMCECVSVHVCTCECVSVYVCTCQCVSVYVCPCECVSLFVCTCECMCVCMSVSLCVCVCTCVCVCLCVYVCVCVSSRCVMVQCAFILIMMDIDQQDVISTRWMS